MEHGLIKDQDAKLQSGTLSILQSPKSGLKGHGCSSHLQNQDKGTKVITWMYQRPLTMTKARSRSNPSKEPPASSKVPYEDLKDIDILCTFKIRI